MEDEGAIKLNYYFIIHPWDFSMQFECTIFETQTFAQAKELQVIAKFGRIHFKLEILKGYVYLETWLVFLNYKVDLKIPRLETSFWSFSNNLFFVLIVLTASLRDWIRMLL